MSSVESYVSLACRLYVCVALVCSSIGKAFTFRAFRRSLVESFHFSARSAKYGAGSLIASEGSAAVLILMGGALTRTGDVIALTLFLLLTGLVASVLMHGSLVVCNCFGRSNERMSLYDLVRNMLFAAASGLCVVVPVSPGFHDATVSVLLLVTALIAFLVSIHLKELAFVLR